MLNSVAPLAGAWIEIFLAIAIIAYAAPVAPLAGAWIEILSNEKANRHIPVAPLAGAWIEISASKEDVLSDVSLPSRERGLKCMEGKKRNKRGMRRSPRGSVD